MELSNYRTSGQAAEWLGLTRQQVSYLCRRRILPAIRVGRYYLITLEDLHAYEDAPARKHGKRFPKRKAERQAQKEAARERERRLDL